MLRKKDKGYEQIPNQEGFGLFSNSKQNKEEIKIKDSKNKQSDGKFTSENFKPKHEQKTIFSNHSLSKKDTEKLIKLKTEVENRIKILDQHFTAAISMVVELKLMSPFEHYKKFIKLNCLQLEPSFFDKNKINISNMDENYENLIAGLPEKITKTVNELRIIVNQYENKIKGIESPPVDKEMEKTMAVLNELKMSRP